MKAELIDILCCPETHQKLRLIPPTLLEQVNLRAQAGKLKTRAGEPVKHPIDGGLVRSDGRVIYPVRQGIPILLIGDSFEWDETAS